VYDWRLKKITGAQSPVVDLNTIKDHMRVENSDEDALIQSYIDAAVEYLEGPYGGGFLLGSQEWEYYTDYFPPAFYIPLFPVQSVDEIRYVDGDGAEQTLASDQYRVDTVSNPARVVQGFNATWPNTREREPNAVTVKFTAGFDPIPADLKQAIFLLVAHYYEIRQPVITGTTSSEIQFALESIIGRYRVPGIG